MLKVKFYLLKRTIMVAFTYSITMLNAQVINSGGENWNIIPTSNITEAGTNYNTSQTYSSVANQIVLNGTLPASLLSLFSSNSVRIGVSYLPTPNRWHNSLNIRVQRTGGTASVNGICLFCSANISSDTANGFLLVSENPTSLFRINFNGGIGLGNSVSYSGVNIQLQLSGISAIVPADAQATIVFTIMSP